MHRAVGSVSPVGWQLGTPMSSVPNQSLYRGTDRRGTARLAPLGHLPQQLLRVAPLLRRKFIDSCLGWWYYPLGLCDFGPVLRFDVAPFNTAARLTPLVGGSRSAHQSRQTNSHQRLSTHPVLPGYHENQVSTTPISQHEALPRPLNSFIKYLQAGSSRKGNDDRNSSVSQQP